MIFPRSRNKHDGKGSFKQTKALKKYVDENFSREDQYAKFVSLIVDESEVDVKDWLEGFDLEVHD